MFWNPPVWIDDSDVEEDTKNYPPSADIPPPPRLLFAFLLMWQYLFHVSDAGITILIVFCSVQGKQQQVQSTANIAVMFRFLIILNNNYVQSVECCYLNHYNHKLVILNFVPPKYVATNH